MTARAGSGRSRAWLTLALAAATLLAPLGACEQKQDVGSNQPMMCEDDPCADVTVSGLHCGRCFNTCSPSQMCGNGHCMDSCPAGTENCSGLRSCSRLDTDDHCGSCGNRCAAGTICVEKRCFPGFHQGFQICYTDPGEGPLPACRDLSNDRLHCGSCNFVCPEGQSCISGVCR